MKETQVYKDISNSKDKMMVPTLLLLKNGMDSTTSICRNRTNNQLNAVGGKVTQVLKVNGSFPRLRVKTKNATP